jgi:hypothetical protein
MIDATIADSSAVAQEVIAPSAQEEAAKLPAEGEQETKAPSAQDQLNSLSPDQYQEWLKTGNLPEADKAESAAAKKAETDTTEAATVEDAEPKTGAEKRIKQLLKERHEARQEAERIKAELESLKRQPAPQSTQTTESASDELKAPRLDDFSTYDEYQKAEREYVFQMARIEAKREIEAQMAEQNRKRTANEIAQQWNKRLSKFKERVPDFDADVASESIPQIEKIAPLIVRSEVGPEIAHYLMLNPDKAEAMAADPIVMAKEFAKLEIRFEGQPEPAASKAKITNALPPPRKISASETALDPLEQAIQKKDYSTYKRLMDEREARASHR